MRMILCVVLVLFTTSSANAISEKEQNKHIENVKSLQSAVSVVTNTLELFQAIEATTGDVPTARQKAATTLSFLFKSCIQEIIWTQFFIGAYIEGAPRACCVALQFMPESLSDKIKRLKEQRSHMATSLEKELLYQADIGIFMLEATVLQIIEIIPDSCPQHIEEVESN